MDIRAQRREKREAARTEVSALASSGQRSQQPPYPVAPQDPFSYTSAAPAGGIDSFTSLEGHPANTFLPAHDHTGGEPPQFPDRGARATALQRMPNAEMEESRGPDPEEEL